jgi:signal transduction histidine kinase
MALTEDRPLRPVAPLTGTAPTALSILLFSLVYFVLDLVSHIEPTTHFGLTLWNPPAGLALYLGLVATWRAVPIVFVPALVATLVVRGLDVADPGAWLFAFVPSVGYAVLGGLLRHWIGSKDPFDSPLGTLGFLLGALVGAGFVALALIAGLALVGPIDAIAVPNLAVRTWIGDATGIAVLLPLLMRLPEISRDLAGARSRVGAETIGAGLVACLLAGIAFFGSAASLGAAYLAIIPVVWVAVRFGLNATILTVSAVQIVIATFALLDGEGRPTFSEFQVLMIVIALIAPILGTAVEYARRTAEDIAHLRFESERLSRLTSVGALGSIIAHELSQPLSAIRAASHVLARGLKASESSPELRRAASTVESQIEAASARIRALRADFQSAGPDCTDVDLVEVARTAARIATAERTSGGHKIRIEDVAHIVAFADRQHVAHILLNLFRNALVATAGMGYRGSIRTVFAATAHEVSVRIEDNGPGVAVDLQKDLFEPMATGRPDGMGLGLFIGRTLANLNGGTLVYSPATSGPGAVFVLTLPTAEK